MNEFEKLQMEVQRLTERVRVLESQKDNFGSRDIIRKDVQFIGRVYDRDGNIVTEINS